MARPSLENTLCALDGQSPLSRRTLLCGAVGGLATGLLAIPAVAHRGLVIPKYKAVAFDAFPIFDPRPVFALAEQAFPGRGAELSDAWRTRQFEYTWLRALSHRYADFWKVTEDALVFATQKLKIELSSQTHSRLMNAYLELKPWPDVVPVLNSLRTSGVRLALLSNFTPGMLESCIRGSDLQGIFEKVVSTDSARTYKPDPRAYQLGVEAFGLRKEEVLFAAFAGWDAAGAKSYGFPTFWVNRQGQPVEELGMKPDGTGSGLTELARFVMAP